MPCICRIQNPYIARAGRVAAAHGEATGRGGAGQNGTPNDRFAQKTTDHRTLEGIEHAYSERPVRSTNNRNAIEQSIVYVYIYIYIYMYLFIYGI